MENKLTSSYFQNFNFEHNMLITKARLKVREPKISLYPFFSTAHELNYPIHLQTLIIKNEIVYLPDIFFGGCRFWIFTMFDQV